MIGEETICFYGYPPEGARVGARLDEYTKLECEDILRHAIRLSGRRRRRQPWDQAKFDEYWAEAQERKRALFAARGN